VGTEEDNRVFKGDYVSPWIYHPDTLFGPGNDYPLFGYCVHARCWELLSHHKVGDIVKENLTTVLRVLHEKYVQARKTYLGDWIDEKSLERMLEEGHYPE
jgi:hypothetical protein